MIIIGTIILSIFTAITIGYIIYSFKELETPEADLHLYGYKNIKYKIKITK